MSAEFELDEDAFDALMSRAKPAALVPSPLECEALAVWGSAVVEALARVAGTLAPMVEALAPMVEALALMARSFQDFEAAWVARDSNPEHPD